MANPDKGVSVCLARNFHSIWGNRVASVRAVGSIRTGYRSKLHRHPVVKRRMQAHPIVALKMRSPYFIPTTVDLARLLLARRLELQIHYQREVMGRLQGAIWEKVL